MSSTSSWRLRPWASIVTMAGKSRTRRCHIASGTPSSNRSTPSTFGRSAPRRVASATASAIASLSAIWSKPTGVLIEKTGVPVSWQIGARRSQARSTLVAIAWASRARPPGF
jgi:hypothetical protein